MTVKYLKMILSVFLILMFLHTNAQGQTDVKDAGAFRYGKVRINREEVGMYDPQQGDYRRIHFRTFSVDSVQGSMNFGNHYVYLKKVVQQDPEASIMLLNATHWERNQRIGVAVTVLGLAAVLFIPMDQKTFNVGMTVNAVAAGGAVVSWMFKRHWANKSIRTWNTHLDEGKYVYAP